MLNNNYNNNNINNTIYANYLLAVYEKNRAIEINDSLDIINTPDYLQYLLTIGADSAINETEKMSQIESELRYKFDSLIIMNNKFVFTKNEIDKVKTEYNFESQKCLFDYTNAIRTKKELESRIQQLKKENDKLNNALKKTRK